MSWLQCTTAPDSTRLLHYVHLLLLRSSPSLSQGSSEFHIVSVNEYCFVQHHFALDLVIVCCILANPYPSSFSVETSDFDLLCLCALLSVKCFTVLFLCHISPDSQPFTSQCVSVFFHSFTEFCVVLKRCIFMHSDQYSHDVSHHPILKPVNMEPFSLCYILPVELNVSETLLHIPVVRVPCSCTDLQGDHVGSVLLPDAEVIHEELQHVKGLFLAHVQQQNSSHKADTLTVANLCGTHRNSAQYEQYDFHYTRSTAGEMKQGCGVYLCIQQRIGFQEVVEGKLPCAQLCWEVLVGGEGPAWAGKQIIFSSEHLQNVHSVCELLTWQKDEKQVVLCLFKAEKLNHNTTPSNNDSFSLYQDLMHYPESFSCP